MDYINNTQQVGRISPFRFWCQKVLPAVYDDSLSYYELLCKVTAKLNELIEVDNTQSDAIKELQETLQSFLDGEIDPYIEERVDEWFEVNAPNIVNRIDNLETEMAAVNAMRVLIFGDSWTTADEEALPTALNNIGRFAFMENYGVSGATITQLASQFNAAIADTSFDHDFITHIIIVAGTNNVYWGNQITYAESRDTFNIIKNAFPNAEIHYFPNNSRTFNAGRNNQYMSILNGAGRAGIIYHPESLSLNYYNNFENYAGTSAYGVQHLSTNGYNNFAQWILELMHGGNFANFPINFNIPMTFSSDSSMTGNIDATYFGNVYGGTMKIHCYELSYIDDFSDQNQGTVRIEMNHNSSGEGTSPISFKFNGTPWGAVGLVNARYPIAYATAASNRDNKLMIPLTGRIDVTPSTIDIVMQLNNPLALSDWNA